MQNHMSNLITAQIDKKMGDSVARKKIKKDSKQNKSSSSSDSSISSEYKKKTPQKKNLKWDFSEFLDSSSDSDSDSSSN